MITRKGLRNRKSLLENLAGKGGQAIQLALMAD
jgi:hypothetical protein